MPSKKSFSSALITGATSGLGKALARFLEEKQIELILTGRNAQDLSVDLSDRTQRQKLLDIISKKKPDLIINNAGFGLYGPSIELSIEEQLKMIEVHNSALVEISLYGALELVKAKKKGTILNISSAASFFPFPYCNIYAASKRFVNQFSLALDAELKEKGVRVLCACPGQIATQFRNRASCGYPQKQDRRTMSVQVAVKHLWKQIEREKPLYIFDGKTKAMVLLAKCLPSFLLNKILMKEIRSRYSSSSRGI